MNLEAYDKLFKDIIRRRHGREVDFKIIESKLEHLRGGEHLKYHDLLMIGDDRFWPFSEYWMWPAEHRVAAQLPETTEGQCSLPDREEIVVRDLCKLFKNISHVSMPIESRKTELHFCYFEDPHGAELCPSQNIDYGGFS